MECGVLWSGRLAILTGTDTRATGTGQWSWYWHSCWYWPNVIPSGTGNGTSTNTRTGTLFFLYFEHGMCCLLSGHLGNISHITDISDISNITLGKKCYGAAMERLLKWQPGNPDTCAECYWGSLLWVVATWYGRILKSTPVSNPPNIIIVARHQQYSHIK